MLELDQTYTDNAIRTFTGKAFDLKILDPNSICIEDIAHGLANTPRFAGQLPKFYSVAQHSFRVCETLGLMYGEEQMLEALLHDASEAYLGDMPKPFKALLPDYEHHEKRVMQAIANKFKLKLPLHENIKTVDNTALVEEWDNLFRGKGPLKCWTPEEAEEQFLMMFEALSR